MVPSLSTPVQVPAKGPETGQQYQEEEALKQEAEESAPFSRGRVMRRHSGTPQGLYLPMAWRWKIIGKTNLGFKGLGLNIEAKFRAKF